MADGADIERIADEIYQAYIADDVSISAYMEKLDIGAATYKEAERYAQHVGTYSGRAIWEAYEKITGMPPTGETFDYDLIQRALRARARDDYDRVIAYCKQVQEDLNYRAGLSMNAIIPDYSDSRVDNLLWKITADPGYTEKFRSLLESAVENMAMSIVDDTIERNAGAQYDSGLRPTITRTVVGSGCVWCRSLAGTHEYSRTMDKEIFRRHQRCRCIVTYDPGTGRRYQDVWSKTWTTR